MTSSAATTWKRLRLKPDPTADDHDWRTNLVSPNRVTAVVGGTTTAGVYSIILTGKIRTKAGAMLDVNFTATFTRAAENDATIAGELEDDFDAGTINPATSTTLASMGIIADVSSATITFLFPPEFYGTLTAVAPAPGTITFPLGDTLPITASAPLFKRAGEGNVSGVQIILLQKDDAGATLLAPGTGTVTITPIELCEIEDVSSAGVTTYRYVSAAFFSPLTTMGFGYPIDLPLRGAKFWTVRITSDSGLDANTDSIEVIWRDSVS